MEKKEGFAANCDAICKECCFAALDFIFKSHLPAKRKSEPPGAGENWGRKEGFAANRDAICKECCCAAFDLIFKSPFGAKK